MKNLRKVLAMVLVVVMAFSLVTVASAATPKVQDYKDASSIKYTEAVDLFTAIGVLNGTDGNFNPTANVTREQAAKIICYMLLGATTADGLKASTSSFSDVAASRWSAGAIQYCVVKGIINGMGDGTFAPEGNVTASQFAKMLLTALGYGKNGEYTGSNWEINVISDATRLGILSLDVDYTAAAAREQVAQYAFNAYTDVKLVAYSKDKSDYEEKTVTLADTQNVTLVDVGISNGVDSHKWAKNGITLNNNIYADAAYKVLVTSKNGKGIFEYTTIGKSTYVASLETGWNVSGSTALKVYVNGTAMSFADAFEAGGAYPANYTTTFENGYVAQYLNSDGRALDLGYTAKGGLIYSLVDTNGNGLIDTVLVTQKSVVVLDADAYVNTNGLVTVPGISGCTNQDKTKVVGYEGLKEDDVVLYYKDNDNVYHIEKAKSITGTITGGSSAYLMFNGAFLMATGLSGETSSIATIYADSANYNTNVTVWVDDGGNMVYFDKEAAAAKTYAVLVGYEYNAMTGVASAKIVKDDGTSAVYTVAADASGEVPNQSGIFDIDPVFGYLVSYTVDANNKITLTKVTTSDQLNGPYTAKANAVTTDAGTYYITSTTKVFYFDTAAAFDASDADHKVTVTTGYSATAGAADNTVVTPVLVDGTTNVYKVILVRAAGAVNTTNKYAFVPSAFGTGPSVTYAGTVATYTYNVYVDGTMTQLKSTSGTMFATGQGLYKYTVDGNGFVTTTTETDSRVNAVAGDDDTKTVDTGYIVLDNGNVIFTDENTKFYIFTEGFLTASVSAGTLKEGNSYVHYNVKYWLEDSTDSTIADAIYFTYTVD